MARRARTSPATTPSASARIARTGAESCTRSPSSSAIRIESCWVPPDEPVLLGAALGLEQVVPAARRCGVEEDVE